MQKKTRIQSESRLDSGVVSMDQFRNEVALGVTKLRGRYDAIFIEPENVSKIS